VTLESRGKRTIEIFKQINWKVSGYLYRILTQNDVLPISLKLRGRYFFNIIRIQRWYFTNGCRIYHKLYVFQEWLVVSSWRGRDVRNLTSLVMALRCLNTIRLATCLLETLSSWIDLDSNLLTLMNTLSDTWRTIAQRLVVFTLYGLWNVFSGTFYLGILQSFINLKVQST